MAYVSQETKKRLVNLAKPILKKYGIKATFSVSHHMELVCNIKSGEIDFIANFNSTCSSKNWMRFEPAQTNLSVNTYHFNDHFTGMRKQNRACG